MLANTAFAVGLAYAFEPEIEALCEAIDFEDAHSNFYRAAQQGLDAELIWSDGALGIAAPGDRIGADALALALVETARRGLRSQGVDAADADPLLDVIAARAERGQTGASWQRRVFEQLAARHDHETALSQLVERYVVLSNEGRPVHEWSTEV